ncbi:MAG: AmmeMemoRadiSam system protein B [Candidatus Aceula meridiana]|nr:AmmeMemoRadiSam system protein B [Candidatus Aceula meridiana]
MKRFFIQTTLFILLFLMCAKGFTQDNIKRPNVSGQFYSSNPKKLSQNIDNFLNKADISPLAEHVEVLIAPHAGYVYSGGVAAYGYKAASKGEYKTIVVIAPSHFVGFDGASIWPEGSFETPLGSVEVDQDFTDNISARDANFKFIKEAFSREHALEVQIPFIQKTFKDFKIVPILMGRPNFKTCQELALALDGAIGNRDDVLIVISTDMSHYHDATTAGKMDKMAMALVQNLEAEALWQGCQQKKVELCGFGPVATALLYAKKRGLVSKILKYADSGDVTGDKSAVVGYFSAVFYPDEKKNEKKILKDKTVVLNDAQKKRLLEIAKETMTTYIKTGKKLDFKEADPRLNLEEGAFVTIYKNGNLRGCIGNILGRGPLYKTIRDMAIASSTQDPRFSPVGTSELKDLEIEISVLSKPWKVNSADEIVIGTHGVIVSKGLFHKGLFLPQVGTEQGWTKEQFLSVLCTQKAGLPADAWKDPSVTLEVFTAQVFSEKDF